jgi:hypothetical protein
MKRFAVTKVLYLLFDSFKALARLIKIEAWYEMEKIMQLYQRRLWSLKVIRQLEIWLK